MDKIEKIIQKIKHGQSDIRFSDIEKLLNYCNYTKVRQKGSHVHFRKQDAPFITIPVHNNRVKRVYVLEIIKLLNL